MRLAADEITIRIGDAVVRLRPSLRAALRLERRYGFDRLARAVADGNLSVIADVIREAGDRPSSIPEIVESIGKHSLRIGVERIAGPIVDFVFTLAGVEHHDGEDDRPAETAGARMTFGEYHEQLYRIATGWLGWTPETAWNATPTEIIEAQKGRVELLRSIFGGGESESTPGEHTEAEVVSGWANLKMLAARGAGRTRA
jgi:hypothetical protein